MKQKVKEFVSYGIVGVLTTIVSLVTYYGLVSTILDPKNPILLQLANIISWIVSVIFAYICNRKYVFKSENTNKLKEATNFVLSRLLTLFLDMAIMFIGVSILHNSDKLVKIISQIVIIILNYIIGKFFVFNKKKEKKNNNKNYSFLIPTLFIILFLIDIATYILNYQYAFYITLIIKSLIFIYLLICVFKSKKYLFSLFIVLLITIQTMYVYALTNHFLNALDVLLNIYVLPLIIVYLSNKNNHDKYINLPIILFTLYSIVFSILYINKIGNIIFNKYIILTTILLLMPYIIKTLYKHKNYFMKSFLLILICLSMVLFKSVLYFIVVTIIFIYYGFRNYQKEENKLYILLTVVLIFIGSYILYKIDFYNLFKMRIDNIQNGLMIFTNANLEEEIFGLFDLNVININYTLVYIADLVIQFGYFGFISYLLVLVFALYYVDRKKDIYYVMYYLILSFVYGFNVFSLNNILIFGLILILLNETNKKRILLVSNMYPSKKYPHYGTFVKNSCTSLESLGYIVDKEVLHKHDNKIIKLICYLKFYIISFIKSIFISYDYYYVHFTSHSGLPVILGTISGKTKLICNTHGNDIVPDTIKDEKNVLRSQKVLKYAYKVVCPSAYFKEVLIKKYNIKEEKIAIFPSGGVDQNVFYKRDKNECLEKLGLDKKYIYYGMVSRIEKDKGYDTLLYALSVLNKKKNLKNTKVIYIGTGDEQDEFNELVTSYKLEDIIIQKKFVDQNKLALYYNCMDLLILPTKRKSESLALVGIEAMASKVFVIGCDLYGPRSYLINNENSKTFKNADELVKCIKEYQNMSDKEKESIINNGYITSQMYKKENMNKYLKDIFN